MGSIKFIKERKKRGRKPKKINASLNEKLQNVQWGEYRIGDLFEKLKTKNLKVKVSDLSPNKTKDFNLPVLTAGIENQGLNNYAPKTGATILKNVISISANGANTGATFYQNKEFTILQDAYAIDFKKDFLLTDNQYLFVVSSISKAIYGNFAWTDKACWTKVKDEKIQLPQKNGEIDFEFMESFVAELNAQRVAELNAYLTITGLKNYELTEEEKNVLENIDKIEYKEKKITDVFKVKNAGNILAREVELNSGDTPYLCASAENNSVSSYINYNRLLKDEGNCIFIGGKTFVVSYQEKDFYSNDSHNLALYLLDNEQRVKDIQLFLSSCVKKSLGHKYSWGDSISNKKIQKDLILVPMKDGKIDYDIMKKIHRIIEKIVIKDVVLWADKKIEATKQVADIG
ncbi:restriction endonuclease subunit S [Veillonella montpellierensis]|uniref:restriction endonuclease subunit S n=1 Tax=Veillonella montpellierensis TaxID=187328 RepID=UPI00068E662B|nr:restriction endonuclease subunit S [Veillonella montpellierensis]